MFAQPRPKKSALGHAPKKRKTTHSIEEITFDKDARTEYLSGFRKRKLARIKEAQAIAAVQAREEKIQVRKQIRDERKQAVEDHVATVHRLLREAREAGADEHLKDKDGSDEEWGGLSDEVAPEPPIDMEEEYIDEDRYTTVTVEAVSVDRDGLHKPEAEQEENEDSAAAEGGAKPVDGKEETEKKGGKEWPKKKKKAFRYENKFERKLEQTKQRAKRDKR
ncbi:nucleolar protein 12-domain-containing protein [Lasiosphaeria hispida]|uniref:Nucleolar protein 12-domain-containing protein n=1 Tax=Lasiosphaeria hispida TaxID=260671 RepID=A0AAJ0HQ05_9PEZI|nr:nucleolar protein 12-domain-containing protein [Lasiosphaeria hispida]